MRLRIIIDKPVIIPPEIIPIALKNPAIAKIEETLTVKPEKLDFADDNKEETTASKPTKLIKPIPSDINTDLTNGAAKAIKNAERAKGIL